MRRKFAHLLILHLLVLALALAGCPRTEDPSVNQPFPDAGHEDAAGDADPDADDPDADDPDANDPDADDPDADDPDAGDPDAGDPDADEPDTGDTDCDADQTPFGGGAGTESDPWLLCSADHLDEVRNHLTAYFRLGSDIDLEEAENFEPIGTFSDKFDGNFDGNNLAISNLTIDELLGPIDGLLGVHLGLFGAIGEDGAVVDLDILDANLTGEERIGVLAGISEGHVENIIVSGVITGADSSIGGLVGTNLGSIHNCHSSVEVTAGGPGSGGLVGRNAGTIDSSSTTGVISGFTVVGGLSGYNSGLITHSFSLAEISGGYHTGGLVGANKDDGLIVQSFAETNIIASDTAAGLVSSNRDNAEIRMSYALGSLEGSETGRIAGLVATNFSTITESFAAVVLTNFSITDDGGLVAFNNGGEVHHSYWDTEVSGMDVSVGGDGLTTSEMGDESNFDDSWVFCPATDCVWEMPAGGPPRLEWVDF